MDNMNDHNLEIGGECFYIVVITRNRSRPNFYIVVISPKYIVNIMF